MTYNPAKHHRKSIRLKGYDYSSPGHYFITICTQNRTCLFGDIINRKMILNNAGKMAQQCWLDIPVHFPNARLDEFVIMPNHIHGIIVLHGPGIVGANNHSPLQNCNGTSKTIGSIVRGFKIGVIKWVRTNIRDHESWQRNYWEHIIRDENEHFRIRQYIAENPLNWGLDQLNGGIGNRVLEPAVSYGDETWKI